ncbi:MAG: D-alanine--D-alanine ligase [Acidobacteriota bacterium]
MNITILYADVSNEPGNDEQDVLVQVEAVRESLTKLGHETSILPMTLNLHKAEANLDRIKPDLVFNLVESLAGTGRFIHFAPALLEHRSIPFTGSGSESLYVTTGKTLSKERLRCAGVPTPDWMDGDGLNGSDGSFELSLLARDDGVQVLPAAEILFEAFPPDKPRIVGYDAKWETGSFEYWNTPRNFDFPASQATLIERLGDISRRCWDIFNLRGYARIDFRIDRDSNPWVIEINANPCISPDAGFVAASDRAGISYDSMIERILQSTFLS